MLGDGGMWWRGGMCSGVVGESRKSAVVGTHLYGNVLKVCVYTHVYENVWSVCVYKIGSRYLQRYATCVYPGGGCPATVYYSL